MVSVTAILERDITAYRVLHTDQNDVWIQNGDKNLTLYDELFVQKVTLSLTFDIFDMTLTSSHDIIATDRRNKCVMKISSSGSVNTLCSTAPLIPRAVCMDYRGHIVVGLQADWTTPPYKLAVYSSNGSSLLQEIKDDEDGNPLFRRVITEVKQNGNGDYVVAVGDRIVCVSSEGRFKWDFSVGKVIWGVVNDKYDNVIIAERAYSKVLLLSSEGKLVTTLLTKKDIRGLSQKFVDNRNLTVFNEN